MSEQTKKFECKLNIRCNDGSTRILLAMGSGDTQVEALELAFRDAIGAIQRVKQEELAE